MRSVSIYFVARIAAALLSFLTVIVFTRILAPADFSLYSIILSTAIIAEMFVFHWVSSGIMRFHSAPHFQGTVVAVAFDIAKTLLAGLLLAGVVVGAAVYLLRPPWLEMLQDSRWPLIAGLTVAMTVTFALFTQALAGLRVIDAPERYAVTDVGRAVLTLGLGATLALQGFGYAGAIGGAIIAALLTGILGLWRQALSLRPRLPDRVDLKILLHYGVPIAVTSGMLMLLSVATRYVVIDRIGLVEASFFLAAATLCERTIGMLMSNLNATVAPTVFAQYEQAPTVTLNQTLRNYFIGQMLLALPLVAVFFFANDVIARVMLGPRLGPQAAEYLPLVTLSALMLGLQRTYFTFSFSIMRKTLLQTAIITPAVILSVVSTYLLLERMGPLGAAVGMLVGAAAAMLATAAVGSFYFRLPLPVLATLRVLVAVAAGVPAMIWANGMDDALHAIVTLLGSAAVIGLVALALDVPMTRGIVRGAASRVGLGQRA